MTDSGSDPDVDDLFAEADDQSRTDVPANDGSDTSSVELADAIAEEYRRVRDGDASTTLTLRDERVAAIVRGLDEVPESRSSLLAGLLRAGLQEADGSVFETDQTAYQQYQTEHESEKR
jgi:hypothetical protein